MKKYLKKMIIVFIFLSGLSLLLYPMISNKWNDYRQKQLITGYDKTVKEAQQAGRIDYEEEWKKARAYNEALLPAILPDSFAVAASSEEPDREYMSCLNLTGDGMMGYVEIPKINIKIPVYHTVSTEILEKAAGHLEGSSLPTGGESTHAVISAHRGLPSASLFTDLDKMEDGDHFLLYILDDILCYEVDKISVVDPEDTKDLVVEEGKDFVTLLTCTPYGVNTQRLLVRGHRVDYEPETVQAEEKNTAGISLHTNYLLWAVVGLGITAAFIVVLYLREQKLKK
ncbi:MAG: class C sortase [Lachnospiraceae bacterium]|nr:class C sortase [Lachnospiraceae bacterium]MDY4770627.1 class C sortase [Lachnospiraceae bacterium]